MWTKLSSKKLFEHSRLTVSEDKVRTGSGKVIRYLTYGYAGHGAVIVATNASNDILFIREYSYLPDKRLLQLPMGELKKDEDPKAGANRELQEETGFRAESLTLIGTYLQNHRRSSNKAYVLSARSLKKSSRPKDLEEEDIKCAWVHKDAVPALIKNGEICDADSLSALRISGL